MNNEICFYKCLTHKSKNNWLVVLENNEQITFDFHKIFLLLDNKSINILNNIYNNDETKVIDKLKFITYMATSKLSIPHIEETYIMGEIFNNNGYITFSHNGKEIDTQISKEDFYNHLPSKRKSLTGIHKVSEIENIAKTLNDINFDDMLLFSKCMLTYNSHTEFLIAFLNWLFSTNQPIYIKKCQICESYYVCTKKDTKFCSNEREIDGNYYPCHEFAKQFKKTYKYKLFKKKDTSLLKKFNSNNNIKPLVIENYINERDKKINEAMRKNNIDILLNFVDNYIKLYEDKKLTQ